MSAQPNLFGPVANLYEDVRQGYPLALAEAVLSYAGVVSHAAEVGAGTGKGTELFADRGIELLCVEPDPQMAAVLAARFPDVTVEISTFERWTPPSDGVPLLYCALAWHWLDPATRCARAHRTLSPGGALAVLGHQYLFADPAVEDAVTEVIARINPENVGPQRSLREIAYDEISGPGLFTDATVQTFERVEGFPTTLVPCPSAELTRRRCCRRCRPRPRCRHRPRYRRGLRRSVSRFCQP